MFASNTSQVSSDATYIEDVFSTYLYTGNGSTQTITNGIDLAGKGGMVWIGRRNTTNYNVVTDTVRGANYQLNTYLTDAQSNPSLNWVFNADGFSQNNSFNGWNASGASYCAWTFRKQPKFFDVVTFSTTTSSTVPITVNHNLGSVPGCIIVKQTNGAADWFVYHRSRGSTKYLTLNSTDAEQNGGTSKWYATPTSTAFTLGGDFVQNATYVAYLFAHNAGGFGLTGTDNVISCGSYTGNGSTTGPIVTLGYEPQWVMIKRATGGTGDWFMYDSMRGIATGGVDAYLSAQAADAEGSAANIDLNATGFQLTTSGAPQNASGSTYIYIAIRRGPMKTPTSGSSVFNAFAGADTSAITTNFPVDFFIENARVLNSANSATGARLLGGDVALVTSSTAATQTGFFSTTWYQSNTSYLPGCFGTAVAYAYRRAPSFFDVVCYTGDSVNGRAVTHNLGVAPELMIIKARSTPTNWAVYSSTTGVSAYIRLNLPDATAGVSLWNSTAPTASNFTLNGGTLVNGSGQTYVAYLFASCPGVSKVGSYSGTGTTKQIDCGFTGGARFVLIKRTDSTGDWYVWDSARGIVAGNDPYLLLNSTAAEVTNTDYVDAYAAGFEISSTAPAAINANGGTFIFLAIS